MKVLSAAILTLVLGLFPVFAAAQSKDKNKPTPMSSSQVTGSSRKDDRRELYYSFTAGPGELVVTLDVQGLSGRVDSLSLVRLTFYEQDFQEVGKVDRQSGLNGENKRQVEKFNLSKETPLVMRLTFEAGASKYKVSLSGAIFTGKPADPPGTSTEALRLPKAGVLTVKMRDGSVHTINLADVQDATVEKESAKK